MKLIRMFLVLKLEKTHFYFLGNYTPQNRRSKAIGVLVFVFIFCNPSRIENESTDLVFKTISLPIDFVFQHRHYTGIERKNVLSEMETSIWFKTNKCRKMNARISVAVLMSSFCLLNEQYKSKTV